MPRILPGGPVPALLALVLALAGPVGAQTFDNYALYVGLPSLELSPLGPSGTWQWQLGGSWANTHRVDPGVFDPLLHLSFDYETWVGRTRLSWADPAGWSWGLRLHGGLFGAGVMDPFLSAFHKAFGFPHQNRDERPENAFDIEWGRWRGQSWGRPAPEDLGWLRWEQSLSWPLLRAPEFTWSAELNLGGPLISGLLPWSGAWSGSFSTLGLWRGLLPFTDWGLSASAAAALAWLGPPEPGPPEGLAPLAWLGGGGLALEAAPPGWGFWGAEGRVWQSPLASAHPYYGPVTGLLNLYWRQSWGPWQLRLILVEEFLSWAVPEVAFEAELGYVF